MGWRYDFMEVEGRDEYKGMVNLYSHPSEDFCYSPPGNVVDIKVPKSSLCHIELAKKLFGPIKKAVLRSFILKFKETGKLEPEEISALLDFKESSTENEKREIEDIVKKEDSRHQFNIFNLTSKFKETANLSPDEMLNLLESKKYATVKGGIDWFAYRQIIEGVEKEYYKDIPSIPRGLEELLGEDHLTTEEVRISHVNFQEWVHEHKLEERHVKVHLKLLEKGLINKCIMNADALFVSHQGSHFLPHIAKPPIIRRMVPKVSHQGSHLLPYIRGYHLLP